VVARFQRGGLGGEKPVHNFDDMRERKFVLYCYYSSQINFMKSHSLTPLSSGDQIKLRENGYLAF